MDCTPHYERIVASNGLTYIPVHLEGSDENIQKAVTLIQNRIGTNNVDENIELSSYENQTSMVINSTTIYVKTSARRSLKVGTIVKRSLVDSIDIDRTAVKASNGDSYVSVHITGGEEATKMSIALIKQHVGVENYDRDITIDHLYNENIEDDKKKKVPNSAVEHKEIRKKIRNRENLSREDDSNRLTAADIEFYIIVLMIVSSFFWKDSLPFNGKQFLLHVCCLVVALGLCLDNIAQTDGEISLTYTAWQCINTVWQQLCSVPKTISGFTVRMLGMPYEMYQAKKIEQTIYVKSSQSKILTGKHGRRKKKGIINKSGVEDIQINMPSDSDDYLSVNVLGSRRAVQRAIALIQEAIGTENVEKEYVSTDKPLRSPPTQNLSSSTAVVADNSADSEPQPNQEDSELEDGVSTQTSVDNVSSDTSEDQEQNNTDSMPTLYQDEQSTVQDDIVTEDDAAAGQSSTPLTTEPVEDEAVPFISDQPQPIKYDKQECTIPSEIGINSTQGTNTREIITESSMSSFNDGSKASKTLSTFTLNENDPLLVFLRSQHQCIRGSVDGFYTWLIKSEYIDSMTALKEAVCDDDYYNDTMKVGSGSSGIKVFKRKVFKRAISEYEGNGNKARTTANLNEPPEDLVCPISLVLMTNDPVLASDGITYERASIEDWFKKSKAKGSVIYSPVHGTEMESLALMPNISLRNVARAFKDEK